MNCSQCNKSIDALDQVLYREPGPDQRVVAYHIDCRDSDTRYHHGVVSWYTGQFVRGTKIIENDWTVAGNAFVEETKAFHEANRHNFQPHPKWRRGILKAANLGDYDPLEIDPTKFARPGEDPLTAVQALLEVSFAEGYATPVLADVIRELVQFAILRIEREKSRRLLTLVAMGIPEHVVWAKFLLQYLDKLKSKCGCSENDVYALSWFCEKHGRVYRHVPGVQEVKVKGG